MCSFDTSYAGLGLNILQCFDGKNMNTFLTVIFIIQKVKIALFRSAGCSVLGAEGFSCSFDTSYAGLGLNILQCFDGKNMNTFFNYYFYNFGSPYPRILIRNEQMLINSTLDKLSVQSPIGKVPKLCHNLKWHKNLFRR